MRRKTIVTFTLAMLVGVGMTSALVLDHADAQRRYRGYRSTNNYYRGQDYRSTAVVPAGSSMQVRLDTKVSTENGSRGDRWTGTVVDNVMVNDRVAIPSGSHVEGIVSDVAQGTHSTRPELALSVRSVVANGRSQTVYADTEPIVAGSDRAKKLGVIAGGAAVGALLGHAVGGRHSTLIGGVLGGAAGYGASRHALRTMQLKPGTVLDFTIRDDVSMRL